MGVAIEHLVDADTRLAYQITERLTGASTMGTCRTPG